MKIYPSLISSDLLNIGKTITLLDSHCDGYHIDVMDDHFVPNLTWGPAFIAAIRKATKLPLHVHLMVDNPQVWPARLNLTAGDTVIFHHESVAQDKQKLLTVVIKNLCHQYKKECAQKKIPGVKKTQFNAILKASFERIYNRVSSSYIIESGLAKTVDSIITTLFKNAGLSTMLDIPANMKNEFTQRRNNILVRIKQRMLERKADHITLSEIEDMINKSFSAFFDRIQHIFVLDWVNAELVNLSKETKAQSKTSSLKPNPESKKLRVLVTSLRKNK